MQTAADFYREIRANYPESVYEDDEAQIARDWADAILGAACPRDLVFQVLHPVVKSYLSQERRADERKAQRAEREDDDSIPGDGPGGYGDWARNTDKNSRASRRKPRQSNKPYVNARINRRKAYLNRTVIVEGFGKVAWRDMTDEMLSARIAMYDVVIAGAREGRQFVVERRMLLRETDGAKTLGEVYELRGEEFPEPPADDLAAL